VVSLQDWLAHFYYRKPYRNDQIKNLERRQYIPHYYTDKGFKGTVVN